MPDPVSSSSKSALLVAFITASLANLASPQSILAPSPAVAARDDGSSPAAKAGGDIDGFFNWPVGRDIVVGGGGAATRHEEAQEKAKRGYKAEGDAYIRFGKRSQEMEESLVQYDEGNPYPERFSRSPEQSYIRFGKRAPGSRFGKRSPAPCTLHFLRQLSTKVERLRHVADCTGRPRSMRRRSDQEKYIRFGKRSQYSEEAIQNRERALTASIRQRPCSFISEKDMQMSPGSKKPLSNQDHLEHLRTMLNLFSSSLKDCRDLSMEEMENGMVILFP